MNLPSMYKQIFKHKRFYSVVLFENLPQLVLQVIYSLFIFHELTVTTLFAMIFSLLSIILTLFEFVTRRYMIGNDHMYMLSIKFIVESEYLQKLSRSQFQSKIERKRYGVSNGLAKILSIDFSNVELLKPIPSKEGVLLIFHIRDNRVRMQDAVEIINNEIASGRLNTVK